MIIKHIKSIIKTMKQFVSSLAPFKRLITYLKPYKSRFLAALLCMTVFSALNGVTMWLVKLVVDKIFVGHNLQMLYMIVLAIPAIFLLKGIAMYGQNYLMFYITQNVMLKIRNNLFSRIIYLSHEFYSRNSSAKLMSRLTNDVSVLQNALFQVPPSIIRDGLTVIVMIGVLFYLNWQFAIIAVIIFPIAAIPLSQFAKKMRSASRDSQKQVAEIYGVLQEALTGIGVIKAFTNEKYEKERYAAENEKYYHMQQRFIRVDARSSPIMEFIGALGVAFIIWYGANDVIKGVWTAGSFFAFMTAAFSVYQPLKNFAQSNSLIQQAISGAERIFDLLDQKPTIVDADNALKLDGFKSQIKYSGVSFSYPEKESTIEDFNLEIKYGEAIALVGPSGSGKTTIASLLLRFYDPSKGEISIDGKNIKNITLKSLRAQIGIVTQDVFLFNDTVRHNIAYGKLSATQNEVVSAAKAANAHTFIENLPNGYDTIIGERGMRLSGGERQRLSIARAVLKNPPILVLDEATSALDAESEKLVQDALERLMQNRTVIIIAHRLSTVIKSDRIIVLDKGKIIESGAHSELLAKDGIYTKLHNLQLL